MIVSLAIAKTGASEAHRKRAGDIIAVKPAGWQWGRKEIENYDLVEMDVPFDDMPDARKLEVPFFEDGSVWHPSEVHGRVQPRAVAKRRYRFQSGQIFDKALGRPLNAGDVQNIKDTRFREIKNRKLI